jgi:hypothetical protein
MKAGSDQSTDGKNENGVEGLPHFIERQFDELQFIERHFIEL